MEQNILKITSSVKDFSDIFLIFFSTSKAHKKSPRWGFGVKVNYTSFKHQQLLCMLEIIGG
jgi:hypothetical protein